MTTPGPPLLRRLVTTVVPRATSIIAAAVGGIVLMGWWLRVEFLKGFPADSPKIEPNSAVGFISLGFALWLLRAEPVPWHHRWIASSAAALTGLIGLLTLFEYGLGRPLGVDQLLFSASVAAETSPIPGRPAFTTAMAFVFLGSALLLMDVRSRRGPQFDQVMAVLSTLVALLALLGYLAGVPVFYGVITSLAPSGMAISSASSLRCSESESFALGQTTA